MRYERPAMSRVDLMVEHCMCCTLVDMLKGDCDPGQNMVLT